MVCWRGFHTVKLAHDPISDMVLGQKVTIGFSGVSFVGKDLFDGLLGMPAVDGAIGQVSGIADRSRSDGGGQDKAVVGVHGSVLLKAVMRHLFLNHPIRFEITAVLFRLTVFIKTASIRIVNLPELLQFFIADRKAGGFNKSGIDSDALINGNPFGFELA
jgi:hypothetical protein